jgi:site-specific recombinase XerD
VRQAVAGRDVTFHTLRHKGATWYISRPGSDLNLLRDLLGHQDLRTTMIYAHLSPQYRKSAVALMGNGGAAADGHKSVTPGKDQVA